MEESISGFKMRGDWGDVVEHGERVALALREVGIDGGPYYEFDEWRPKTHERIDEDVSEKTAAQASVDEGKGERAGKSPGDDLQTAGEKLTESYEQVEENDTESARESWGESIEHVARAADSASRKALRKVEDAVYRNVMTQMAPYYFDNELVSANIQEVARAEDGETFVFEVNVNDDELKDEVSAVLGDYESEIDRWHVDTEKRTEDVAAAEGVEPPAEEGGPDSTTT